MKEMWNQRYSAESYLYGKAPNPFFKEYIDSKTAGSILLPAEGEGRNAVYAAKKGWKVFAFDFSDEAKRKAEQLAEENGVKIHYFVSDILSWHSNEHVDCIGLFYAHIASDLRKDSHQNLVKYLKKGGTLILEGFSKNQIHYNSGGPKKVDMLFSKSMLEHDFKGLNILSLQETITNIEAGDLHNGTASLIRMLAEKE